MRRQRVDLRDARRVSDERGADGAPGTDVVPVVFRVLDQFLGDHVEDREPVRDDGGQFLVEALRDILGDRISVERFRLVPAEPLQFLLCPVDGGREVAGGHRADALDHVRDPVRIVDDDFLGAVAEVFELGEHLLRRAEEQGGLVVGVLEALAGHDDGAELGAFRVDEVDVAGGDRRFAGGVSQREDAAVDVPKVFLGLEPRRHHLHFLRGLVLPVIRPQISM